MAKIFDWEHQAKKHFRKIKDVFGDKIDVEPCDKCGRWSASQADDPQDGAIVASHCCFDRLCLECEEEENNL
jgi:hypothetical protein